MNSDELAKLEKFKTLTRWMCQDGKAALFPPAKATFVVATALFNFIEICGLFLIGPKDLAGKATTATDRFNAFFDYLGTEYEKLRKNNPLVYNELRCGMTHEGLPKNRPCCIYGLDKSYSDDALRDSMAMNHILLGSKLQRVTCGVIFNGNWHVIVGKLLIDFEDAVNRFVGEIESGQRDRTRFFEATDHINLKNFITA